jgi:hypothetical protein
MRNSAKTDGSLGARAVKGRKALRGGRYWGKEGVSGRKTLKEGRCEEKYHRTLKEGRWYNEGRRVLY